jgi:hypothetical protein
MGVMGCHRKDCEQIMCDTYVSDIGYICWECKSEFKEYLIEMNEDEENMSERSIKLRLKTFMDTSKDTYTEGEEMSVDDFFSSYDRDEE